MKLRTGFVSNSSSSSFICKADISPKKAETLLRDMLSHFYAMTGQENCPPFEEVFCKPYLAPKGGAHPHWHDYYPELAKSQGKLIIDSTEDNSIPYALEEIIGDRFDAVRCHRG